MHQMQEKVQDQGNPTNRRRARPHWQGEDEQGDYDGVDQKKKHRKNNNSKPRGIFTQWAEQYNMDNPVNLKEYPRVEFWVDTKWEPYKEGIQQEIRRQLTTYGKDFAELIETTIDLNCRDEEWVYTAHFFPDTGARQCGGSLQEEYDG